MVIGIGGVPDCSFCPCTLFDEIMVPSTTPSAVPVLLDGWDCCPNPCDQLLVIELVVKTPPSVGIQKVKHKIGGY